MAVGDEESPLGAIDDVGRLIEESRARPADAGFAERHQHLAVGAELEDLVALAVVAARIGDPQVAVAIDGAPCGKMNIPSPQLASSLPVALYFRIGASCGPAHEFAKQRWMT